MPRLLTRADLIWIAVLAALGVFIGIYGGFPTGTIIFTVLLVTAGRTAYALYARSTWR